MGIIKLLHVDGKTPKTPSDVLAKFLPYCKLQPLLFQKGKTMVDDSKRIPIVIHSLSTDTPFPA